MKNKFGDLFLKTGITARKVCSTFVWRGEGPPALFEEWGGAEMPWWAWLLSVVLSVLLLLGLALQLMKLRIFGRYLRENKTDQLRLQLKLGFLALCYEQGEDEQGEKRSRIYPLIGRLLPAGFLQRELPSGEEQGAGWWKSLLHRESRSSMHQTIGQVGPLLKEITWSRFDLELSWGWGEPAWTGLAAGGIWAAGGMITGLLHQYFTVAARPRVKVLPLWSPAGLRMSWEGELSLSLYSCLKFWRAIK